MQLRHQPARNRTLSRQCVRAAGTRRHRIADHHHDDSENGRPWPAAGSERRGNDQARPGDHGRRHRFGQIEDPIEYVHDHKNCLITQREVGVDTESWEAALKNTLRQAPDVILIGEIRERETMEHAIAFAETGHLCMGTLHANSSNQALDRIINFFPEERRAQLLMDLSLNLKGLVSQRLMPLKDSKGRAAAIEILLNSPLISDLIFKGEVHEIKEIMKKSREMGMQTFDQALFDLYEGGKISYEDAMRNADSMNDLRLAIKLHSKEAKNRDITQGIDHLNIV